MKRLRKGSRRVRFRHFMLDTPLIRLVVVLVVLWLCFAAGVYWAEQGVDGATVNTYGKALYWGVAAFSTAGIADPPVSAAARLIGGLWIVIGSVLFFGTVVATITAYFLRPLQRPARQIIETIEYNLEQLGDLSIEELELLKETTDALIEHMERLKARPAG